MEFISDLLIKLDAAERRCQTLDRQLDSMRHMLPSEPNQPDPPESSQRRIPECFAPTQHRSNRPPPTSNSEGQLYKPQMDKILDLEREHMKLSNTQAITEVCFEFALLSIWMKNCMLHFSYADGMYDAKTISDVILNQYLIWKTLVNWQKKFQTFCELDNCSCFML